MTVVARPAAAVLAFAALVGALALAGWPTSSYRDNDFFQFWAGPHALFEGASPYDVAWSVEFHDRHGSRELHQPPLPAAGTPPWSTAYPLWTFVLLVPLALLPFAVAAPLWFALNAFAIAVGLVLLARVALATDGRRDSVVLVGLAAAFQPTWLALAGGNITGLLFGVCAAALFAAATGRARLAGALLALLIVKPQAFVLVGLAFLIASRDRRRLVEGGALVALPLFSVSILVRPGWIQAWLASAGALQSSYGSNATAWTLDRAIPLGPLVPLAFAAALVVGWVWWWRARRPALVPLVAASVPVSLLLAPHGWSYDQLHLLITIAVVLEAIALARSRVAWLVALATVAVPLPWALYALAFQRAGEEWSVVTPLLLLAFLVVADARVGARTRVLSGSPA